MVIGKQMQSTPWKMKHWVKCRVHHPHPQQWQQPPTTTTTKFKYKQMCCSLSEHGLSGTIAVIEEVEGYELWLVCSSHTSHSSSMWQQYQPHENNYWWQCWKLNLLRKHLLGRLKPRSYGDDWNDLKLIWQFIWFQGGLNAKTVQRRLCCMLHHWFWPQKVGTTMFDPCLSFEAVRVLSE